MIHFVIVVKVMATAVQMPQSAKMAALATVTMVLRGPDVFVMVDSAEHFVRYPQVSSILI